MYVTKPDDVRLSIKVWLTDELEPLCLEQASNLARLPFAFKHIALMPDTHPGYGMPVGGVLATEKAIVPNAVGVDIGCGMCFVSTDLDASFLTDTMTDSGSLLQSIIGNIMREVPVGFAKHRSVQVSHVLDSPTNPALPAKIESELDNAYLQVGTLGGGNHFIEVQADEDGKVGLMVHTGSRHLGFVIANYFNKIAEGLNAKWHSVVTKDMGLAFLPTDSDEGRAYIDCMNLALRFSAENRMRIMRQVGQALKDAAEKHGVLVEFSPVINAHHNYATIENHFGRNVWVHRKGAISAKAGEVGIVPGAMGSYSYIVEGLGNPESFFSSSHGAGRVYSRTQAKREFSAQQVTEDLKAKGVVLGMPNKKDVAEECVWAYKSIDEVIANEQDLTRPIRRLHTLGVVKGGGRE
jgi:tRNA-splicing ligase RtcB (3'-phosphate/5'-hydroxy nucleic acid ligase)